MLDEQTKRAVETMAQCGCDLEALCSMFPQVPRENVVEIWNYIYDARKNLDAYEDDTPNISCNCS